MITFPGRIRDQHQSSFAVARARDRDDAPAALGPRTAGAATTAAGLSTVAELSAVAGLSAAAADLCAADLCAPDVRTAGLCAAAVQHAELRARGDHRLRRQRADAAGLYPGGAHAEGADHRGCGDARRG